MGWAASAVADTPQGEDMKEKISGIHMDLKVFMKDGEFQVTVRFEYSGSSCEIWDVKSYIFADLHLMRLWTETVEAMASAFEVPVVQSFRFVAE